MLKRLKIGFAAIIAVLAITATVASHAGAFNGKLTKAAVTDGCYRNVTIANPSNTYAQGQTPCPPAIPPATHTLVSATNLIPGRDVNTSCILPYTALCCVIIVSEKIVGFKCGTYIPVQ